MFWLLANISCKHNTLLVTLIESNVTHVSVIILEKYAFYLLTLFL